MNYIVSHPILWLCLTILFGFLTIFLQALNFKSTQKSISNFLNNRSSFGVGSFFGYMFFAMTTSLLSGLSGILFIIAMVDYFIKKG